jgi:hypothetical protein
MPLSTGETDLLRVGLSAASWERVARAVRGAYYDSSVREERRRLLPEAALLALAAAFAVFHHLPSASGEAGDFVDLVTPLAVVGTAALVLASVRAGPAAVALALLAGVLYVDGHGIHLAANSIGHEALTGNAEDVTRFWDETFGHIEWHLGWILLLAAVAAAEALSGVPRGSRPTSYPLAGATVMLLGFTLFTSTVEGGTWWLAVGATAVFLVWVVRTPRPMLVTAAGAFALASLLMAGWAIWQGGIPQFSDVGWL